MHHAVSPESWPEIPLSIIELQAKFLLSLHSSIFTVNQRTNVSNKLKEIMQLRTYNLMPHAASALFSISIVMSHLGTKTNL